MHLTPPDKHQNRRQFLLFAFVFVFGICAMVFSTGSSAQRPYSNANIRAANAAPMPEPLLSTVRGRVIYEDTGRPVRRAGIVLMGFKGGREKAGLTDNNGVFEIKDVQEGSYFAMVNAPGVLTPFAYADFTAMTEREGMENALGEIKTHFDEIVVGGGGTAEILVRAKRGGAIGGRIYYADGDPAIGLKVEVLRKKDEKFLGVIPNITEFFPMIMGVGGAGGGRTDDRGIYRISGLPPGEYVVRVTEPASHKPNNEAGNDRMFGAIGLGISSLVSTYHPDTPDAKQADIINLELGQEAAEVNVMIPERGFYNIAGKIVARGSRQAVKGARISVIRKDNTASFFDKLLEEGPGGGEATDDQGGWNYKELPAGTYTIKVKPPYSYGDVDYDENGNPIKNQLPKPKLAPVEKEIVIADKDLNDLVIEMPLGATVSGTVIVEGNRPLPLYSSISALNKEGEILASNEIRNRDSKTGADILKFDFNLDGLSAGKAFLNFNAAGVYPTAGNNGRAKIYYVKSIKQGVKDLLATPLEVGEGANVSGVEVVLGDDGGKLKGKVNLKDEDKPSANRKMIFVPTDEKKWQTQALRLFAITNNKGEFEVMGAPHEYFVIFLNDKDKLSAINEAWIRERSSSAEKVAIKANDETTVNLTAP